MSTDFTDLGITPKVEVTKKPAPMVATVSHLETVTPPYDSSIALHW